MKVKSNKKKSPPEIKLLKLEKDLAKKKQGLKIETALEKVRIKAMRMKKPDDMLGVCKTISLQLESLGVNEIRNVQTAIFYRHRGTYMNYEYYAKHNKTVITETTYTNNKLHEEFAKKMLGGKGEYFISHIKGKKVKEWIAYQKTTNVFIDKHLNAAPSLNYYWFSLGPVALGTSTYHPLTGEEINLFKRFVKVFELAYRRYLDIEKAEAQTREAQIEAALERVRSRSLAMHESAELNEVVLTLFDQIKMLQIDIDSVNINILNESNTGFDSWFVAPGYSKALCLYTPYFNTLVMNDIFSAIKNKQNLFSKVYSKKDKNAYFSYLYKHSDYNNLPDERKKWILEAKQWCLSIGISGMVGISIHNYSGKTFSDDDHNILLRFTNVFYQSYRRFLDLQKAEAQAREAQIEAALERVRARTMAMHESIELAETAAVLFKQLIELGIEPNRLYICIMTDETGNAEFWITTEDGGKICSRFSANVNENFSFVKMYKGWIEKKESIIIDMRGKELQEYVQHLRKKNVPFKESHSQKRRVQSIAYFSHGFIGIASSDLQPEDTMNLLKRFATVFNLTYQRFLDLKNAEAQAREAQIEAALERVRGKAMAMHGSEDFVTTIVAFYHELAQLSFTPRRCGVGLINKETRIAELSTLNTTDKGDSIELIGKIKLEGHPVLEEVYDNWLTQNEYHPVLTGNEIKEYYKFIGPKIAIPDFSGDSVQYGYFFYFKEGGVYSWAEKKFSDEELQIYRRFTTVLSLTYRRYLDLKEAEARAIESIRQASLDRIRAEIASMRTSEDLNRITPIIWRELKNLKVPFIRCGVYIVDEKNETVQVYLTTPDGKPLGVLNLTFDSNEITSNTVQYWKKRQIYKEHWDKEEFISWTKSMVEIGQIQNSEKYQGSSTPPESLDLHFVPFAQGMLYVGNTSPLSEKCLHLVKTLAEAFSIAYARYEDFKKLEEAKVEVESAFGELDILSKELKIKNEKLEIENQRKAIEMEEARQLQLSMLPKELPKLPNLQIAAYMRTATEVGGDYYDYILKENGELNIGFGDATGHGLQAGTMITLMKGFFTSDAAKLDPQAFMNNCNSMIKEIKLGRILMSFGLLRITDSKLLITSAGMPPVYYYNKSQKKTEEILIQGTPLGAIRNFTYKVIEKKIKSGDTILMLTDGLPELRNKHDEMFNYARIKRKFNKIAEKDPEEIIDNLVESADNWMSGTQQTDDITFVVIKVN